MILTEKTKEDFLNWVGLTEDMYLCSHSKIEIEYMQIEWFDSVGIYITVDNHYKLFNYKIQYRGNIMLYDDFLAINSRQEATKQAIIKANEIYNNR